MKVEKINYKARHRARTLIVQALYQWQMNVGPVDAIIHQFHNNTSFAKTDDVYFQEILKGVIEHIQEIDAKLQPILDRKLVQLNGVELAILRLGIYELLYRVDIPFRVVINEACELAKLFGTIEGFKFVNGVLDKAAREFRKHE